MDEKNVIYNNYGIILSDKLLLWQSQVGSAWFAI
jgi:hypothetical protein